MKKILITLIAALMILVGCGQKPAESEVLKVSGIETGYGKDAWNDVIAAFTEETGIEVEFEMEKNIHETLRSQLTSGTDVPDVVYLSLNSEGKLPDTLVAEKGMLDISDLLNMNVLGEETKVKDKVTSGFLNTLTTDPYGDGKTYLAPVFYSPTGIFYNINLFEDKGWDLPTTWDEMWALGETAKAEGISLFTYPTSGYLDGFMAALLTSIVGQEDYYKLMNFDLATWEKAVVKEAYEILDKLASYVSPDTVSQANGQDFKKNQGAIIEGKALFMPNGTWVVNEMKDEQWPGVEDMNWGLMALPAVKAGGDRYATTFTEQVWVPKDATNVDNAKKFISFLYSDVATKIFYEGGGIIQPVNGATDLITEEDPNRVYYDIFKNGALSSTAGFAARDKVEGVEIADVFYETINEVATGAKTGADWYADMIEVVKAYQ